jgi:hypothetical protein
VRLARLAGGPRVNALHWQATGATEIASYVATEHRQNGAFFDKERGLLAGPSVSGEAWWGAWRLRGSAAALGGDVEYLGQTQIGFPIASRSHVRETALEAGATYRLGSTPFFVGLAFDSRTVDRRIESTPLSSPLHESLRLLELGPEWGARWEWPFGLELALRASWRVIVHAEFDVDFEGAFEDARLSLPGSDAMTAVLEGSFALWPRVRVVADGFAETFAPARSGSAPLVQNGAVSGAFQYPGSVQTQWGARVGLALRF